MNMFEAASTYGYTQNGALTYSTTLNKCLDLFSMGGAMRNVSEATITDLVKAAYEEDNVTCLCVLFYLRDIREGMGEKRIFKVALRYLIDNYLTSQENKNILISACIEFGYWKEVFDIFTFDEYKDYVKNVYNQHVKEDKYDMMEKYLPSISSKKNALAEKIASYLGLTPKQYRKYLSKARTSLNIVERNLCARTYSNINYSQVPSRAGLIYRNAFIRNDNDRYREFLSKVKKGEVKVNTRTLYPYEIVKKYVDINSYIDLKTTDYNELLEVLWKNLKDYTDNKNNIVVVDVSGSMESPNYLPISISTSLGIYFAERNKGIFHNNMITFSDNPNFISFEDKDNLRTRIMKTFKAPWGMSTNLQAVFDLILNSCVREKVPQEEMPATIYVISDMEFNEACSRNNKTNFEEIDRKFREAGYKRPNLVFWNVNSYGKNVPVRQDENGVALVSGASPSIFQMIISGDINPLKMMKETVLKERYTKYVDSLIG